MQPANRTMMVVVKVALGIAALGVMALGVWPTLFGAHALYLGDGMVPTLAPTGIALPVQADDGFLARRDAANGQVSSMFPWQDTTAGTRDATTGLPPVEVFQSDRMYLSLAGPTWTDRVDLALPYLVVCLLVLGAIYVLWRGVRAWEGGQSTTASLGYRVVWLALILGGGGSLYQIVRDITWTRIVERSAANNVLMVDAPFSFVPLVLGAVMLVAGVAVLRTTRKSAMVLQPAAQ